MARNKRKRALHKERTKKSRTAELRDNLRILKSLRTDWGRKASPSEFESRVLWLKAEIKKTIREHVEAPAKCARLDKDIRACQRQIAQIENEMLISELGELEAAFNAASSALPMDHPIRLAVFASARKQREDAFKSTSNEELVEMLERELHIDEDDVEDETTLDEETSESGELKSGGSDTPVSTPA